VKIGTLQKIFFSITPKTRSSSLSDHSHQPLSKEQNKPKMKVLVADEDSGSIKGTLTIQNYCPLFFFFFKEKGY